MQTKQTSKKRQTVVTMYRLSSDKMNGHIDLTYENGFLKSIVKELKEPLFSIQWTFLRAAIPNHDEDGLGEIQKLNIRVEQIECKSTYDKILLWCQVFKEFKQITYTFNLKEKRLIKEVAMNRELLEAYFKSTEWWCKQKSVSNYFNYYNNIKLLVSNNGTTVSQFPDGFDKAYAAKLKPEQRKPYFDQLRSKGYQPVWENNIIVNWIKP